MVGEEGAGAAAMERQGEGAAAMEGQGAAAMEGEEGGVAAGWHHQELRKLFECAAGSM